MHLAANKKKVDALDVYQHAMEHAYAAQIEAKTKLAAALGDYQKAIEELSKELKDGQRTFELAMEIWGRAKDNDDAH